jgi:DNA-binding transcriptional ArsR family regulator
MRGLEHPPLDSIDLATLLDALGDPVRLEVVRQLAASNGIVCGNFDVAVSMSTLSHHLKILRAAGLLQVTPQGRFRRHELRSDEVEARFPGLLASVLAALHVTTPGRESGR